MTSIIGAENFITAQNRADAPGDPFARQCFVELVQSLIFMSEVLVAHPTNPTPQAADFGTQPHLLRALLAAGLVRPLHLSTEDMRVVTSLEDQALDDLKSWQGNHSLVRFVDQALVCDDAGVGGRHSLSARLRGWAAFQAANVRSASGHHGDRIATADGIEDDPFGEWARAAGVVLEGPLRRVAPPGEEAYVAATLARGMRYQARAVARSLSYQAHPMRRDFLLTFDLTRDGASASVVFAIIKAVRGVQDHLSIAAGDDHAHRVQLLELELPLLGGRLWRSGETGRLDDRRWIDLVAQRVADYRERATDLRVAIERCVTDEDYLRLVRDIDAARRELSERLGLRHNEPSALEREIVSSVASVAEAVPGAPKVSGLWFGTRPIRKRIVPSGTPVQRFVYREFVQAWKRSGH